MAIFRAPGSNQAPLAGAQYSNTGRRFQATFDTGAAESARQFDVNRGYRDRLLDLLGVNFGSKKKPGSLGLLDPTASSGLYGDLLGEQRQFAADQQGMVDAFGDSHRAQMTRDFDAATNSAMARLEARGLGSSSIAPGVQSQFDEARQQSMLGLEDALLAKRLEAGQTNMGAVFGTQQNQINSQQQLLALLSGIMR